MASSNAVQQSHLKVAEDVELGYAEESDSFLLESHFFVSKIGGKPAWLSFKPLPTADDLKCSVCSTPAAFLLQVYAPLADKDSAFHRTIFVFICRNPQCCSVNKSNNITVLRCQLPRENDFYSSEALDPEDFDETALTVPLKRVSDYSKVCLICGCHGDKQCAQCKTVTYCGKEHQLLHWKLAHKRECKENTDAAIPFDNPFLFPEYELTIETEIYDEEMGKSAAERTEEERMRDYRKYVETHGGGKTSVEKCNGVSETAATTLIEKCRDDENLDELESVVKKTDKAFKKFHRRIEQNPEQVLRYQRNGQPLWASNVLPYPNVDIPNCSLCGSSRSFEFQIMPHLLSYLDVDCVGQSIDWATIAVYTCSNNCDIPDVGYAKEVAFKQDFDE